MKNFFTLVLGVLSFGFASSAYAARWANQFVEFELPAKWGCTLEGAEWICQSTEAEKKKDAIIVLAAKLKGDQDSLDQYLTYLKQAKSYTSVSGKPVKSEVKYAKYETLNEHSWVDSLHLESEIPGFFTRYLATVKNDIAVLVTYSINQKKYHLYLNDFEVLVKSLRVFRKPGQGLNTQPQEGQNVVQGTDLPTIMNNRVFPQDLLPPPPEASSGTPAPKKGDDMLFYIVLAAAVVAYLIWRRKKK